MAISLRLSKEETALFQQYAALKKITVSELIRQAVIERIEDEYDIQVYQQAMAEYLEHPVTFSLEEAEKELGLKWDTE